MSVASRFSWFCGKTQPCCHAGFQPAWGAERRLESRRGKLKLAPRKLRRQLGLPRGGLWGMAPLIWMQRLRAGIGLLGQAALKRGQVRDDASRRAIVGSRADVAS
jgi:hypothetical protein